MSLHEVPDLGNRCGQSEVGIAFVFVSDDANGGPTYTGTFVDDVLLQRAVASPPPTLPLNDGHFGFGTNGAFGFNFTGRFSTVGLRPPPVLAIIGRARRYGQSG